MKKNVLLLIFILCLGLGFTIGYLSIPKENNNINNKFSLEDANEIIENFTIGYGCNNIEEYTKKEFVTNKDISNDRAFQVVQYLEFNQDINAITLEDVKRKIALYFGDDYVFNPDKISNSCNLFNYNNEDKIFYRDKEFCVVNCSNNQTLYKVKDINKDNDYIDIYINILFNSQAESMNYYKDYARKELVDYDDISSYIEEGDLYLFRFKKIGSYYQFVSSQIKH